MTHRIARRVGMSIRVASAAAVLSIGLVRPARAASETYVGGTGYFNDATNYSPQQAPNIAGSSAAGDTVTVNASSAGSTVNLTGNGQGDFQDDGTVVVNSGVLTQSSGNYVEIGNRGNYSGELDVNSGGGFALTSGGSTLFLVGNNATQTGTVSINGGAFNGAAQSGTAVSGYGVQLASGSFSVSNGGVAKAQSFAFAAPSGATPSLSVTSGGSLTLAGGFASSTTTSSVYSTAGTSITLSGNNSLLNIGLATGDELHAQGGAINIDGGSLLTSIISFDGGAAAVEFGGGLIDTTRTDFNGIYGGNATHYLDFTASSTGVFFLAGGTQAGLTGLLNGAGSAIRYDGVADDASAFTVQPATINNVAGEELFVTNPIGATPSAPEPASLSAMALGGAGVLGRRRRLA